VGTPEVSATAAALGCIVELVVEFDLVLLRVPALPVTRISPHCVHRYIQDDLGASYGTRHSQVV
jgi:hypothetical protein